MLTYKTKHHWENNVKVVLEKLDYADVNWIELVQVSVEVAVVFS
jgi:hypothetical protein